MQTKKWTSTQVIALILTVGLVMVLMGAVLKNVVAHGYDCGKYTEDELPTDLFDFFEALSGKKSDYKKEMMKMQTTAFWLALIVCIPCGIILNKVSTTNQNVLLMIGGGTVTSISLLTCMLVLLFYSFSGSPRVAVLVIFFLMALWMIVFMGIASKNLKLYALVLLAFVLALGFLVAVFVAQLVGLAAVILQELFWIVLVMLVLSGGSNVIFVRIIY